MATDNRDDDGRLVMVVGDERIDLDITSDFNAIDARLFRDQTGFGFTDGIRRLMDPDVLATFVWLFKRKSNKRLRWEDVAERVTFRDVEATTEAADVDDVDDDQGAAPGGRRALTVQGGTAVPEDDPS